MERIADNKSVFRAVAVGYMDVQVYDFVSALQKHGFPVSGYYREDIK